MENAFIYNISKRVALISGGTGSIGHALAIGFASHGAHVILTSRNPEKAESAANTITNLGLKASFLTMDISDESSVQRCCDSAIGEHGSIDILVNAVGGNLEGATTGPGRTFFDLAPKGIEDVLALNFVGGVMLPCKVFGKAMTQNPNGGSIINISSMAGSRPLTRVVGYGAAKAAVENFTRWLAVHVAQEFSPKLRVNAIAPGFFLTDQNRFLLTKEDGELTDRGKQILAHTPMGEFGKPEDLVGAAVWLASDASRFVTGTVVAVDGGFSAYAGV